MILMLSIAAGIAGTVFVIALRRYLAIRASQLESPDSFRARSFRTRRRR